MRASPTPQHWTPSFNQRLVLARAEAYEVSGRLPNAKRGNVRAKFWIHWIKRNALDLPTRAGGVS